MQRLIARLENYSRWLHTGWPAGTLEALPEVAADGTTALAGVRVVGDLRGIPLLKFAVDSGARAISEIIDEPSFQRARESESVQDLIIIGAGVAGCSAAIEAKKAGLSVMLFESTEWLSTLKNFPKRKPIFTYPSDFIPMGSLSVEASEKEALVERLETQLVEADIDAVTLTIREVRSSGGHLTAVGDDGSEHRALRVIVAIGKSGKFRRLGVDGDDRAHVLNRLHDPADYAGKDVVVVGGGDSALETATSLASAGARVTLSYRGENLTRPKEENIERLDAMCSGRIDDVSLSVEAGSQVKEITESEVILERANGERIAIGCDVVFPMVGREAPLDFFRRSKIPIRGEWTATKTMSLVGLLAFCVWLYHWKSYGLTSSTIDPTRWSEAFSSWLGMTQSDHTSVLYTVLQSARSPSFYYTLLYSLTVLVFGIRRIRRRKTPYVEVQTITLIFVQWLPLFILPEVLLPWMGRNELFVDGATLRPMADWFFEPYDGGIGIERAYWRSYGFILAWPLMVYNWFTDEPMWGWIIVGVVQTFVLIPWAVRRWGKGAICGWVCSCGALAETLGDTHRHKMPHGPRYNRLNLVGQVILAWASILMFARVLGWLMPGSWIDQNFHQFLDAHAPWTYKWLVDVFLGGILGVGLYFHFSGRMWCRFACPLAALMHIYARFSRFRIFAEKSKCISCNVCTSVCHQGIDVMGFASRGQPLEDPQCVRCSACVQGCPTGVLSFGRYDDDGAVIHDSLSASLVQIRERDSEEID